MARRSYRDYEPAPETSWQMGRTAADVSFVNLAANYLQTATNRKEIAKLKAEIDAIRKGTKKLTDWITIEEFLQS